MNPGQSLAIRVLQLAWTHERSAQELADALAAPYLEVIDAIEFLHETGLITAEFRVPAHGTPTRFRITLHGASWLEGVLEDRPQASAKAT